MRQNLVTSTFRLQESTRDKRIAYVAKVKGDGGKDWEWTFDSSKAARVSFYWARRFMADRRHCGVKTAQCLEFDERSGSYYSPE